MRRKINQRRNRRAAAPKYIRVGGKLYKRASRYFFEGSYRYVSIDTSSNGNLIITPSDEFFEAYEDGFFEDMDDWGKFAELLEDVFANSELDLVRPEDVGALTDCVLIGESLVYDDIDRVEVEGDIWWHANCAVEDPIEALYTKKKLVFRKG